jgi:hypothetical protein
VTRFSIDPVTIGFDTTLDEYVEAVAAGGFTSAEWPVIWACGDDSGSLVRARAAFERMAVEPTQFTSAIGVPGNLAVERAAFAKRVVEFQKLCRVGRAVGSTRASLFVDEHLHGGIPLSFNELVERVRLVADAAASHGVSVVIGWHDRSLLDKAAAVHQAAGGGFGLIIDTFTLHRSGLNAGFVDQLPTGVVGWVRVGDGSTHATAATHPSHRLPSWPRRDRSARHGRRLPAQRLRRAALDRVRRPPAGAADQG